MPQPNMQPGEREAIAQFVEVISYFASCVLARQADLPAHVVGFGIDLLDASQSFVDAELAAQRGFENV
jgi:hypothetical protein